MDSSSLRHSYSVTVCAPVQETGLLVRLCFGEETKPPPHQTTADWRKYIQSVDEEDFCSSEQPLMCTCIYVRDRCKTRTVLKPSDGFEAGQTAAKRPRRL